MEPALRRRRGLALLLGLVLAGMLAELLLRVPLDEDTLSSRDEGFWQQTHDMHAALYERARDPALIYRPRRDASAQMPYGEAAFNAEGLRERRVLWADPGPRRRVLMLGDSLAWGELVAREHSLPAQLEGALGADTHQVLNLGVTGYDTAQEAAWYRERGGEFQHDALVLVFCLNDFMIMSGPYQQLATPAERQAYQAQQADFDARAPLRNETVQRRYLEELRQGSQLGAVLRHLWRWHRLNTFGGYVDEYLLSAADPARSRRVQAALQQLAEDARDHGAEPVLVISPALYWWRGGAWFDRYPWWGVHEQVREMGEQAGFVVVDPLPLWLDQDHDPADWRFDGDNLHYNAEGNRRFAETLARSLDGVWRDD